MSDEEKIVRVKEIVSKWALDDKAGAVEALIEIMELLDFDPYRQVKKINLKTNVQQP